MAPGCTMSNDHTQSNLICNYQTIQSTKPATTSVTITNQIPLPATPAPLLVNKQRKSSPTLDTVDSFEILEQTIMKQKRLGKYKNTDMRMKILLKRTFNLVCEMMDRENGFDLETTPTATNESVDSQDLQNTLIINLSETESLDSTFQGEDFGAEGLIDQQLNYTDLENFNYENLLENEENSSGLIDKSKSFLTTDFFSACEEVKQVEPDTTEAAYSKFKRRRSSADDDEEDEFESSEYATNSLQSDLGENSFYLFDDLTNSGGKTMKKRCLNESDDSCVGVSNKKFKESSSSTSIGINIVT